MTGITNTLTYLLREDGLCERRLSQVVWMFATDDSPCASLACCRRWLFCPSRDFLTAIPRKLLPHLVRHAWAKAGDRLGIDERFEARGIENAGKKRNSECCVRMRPLCLHSCVARSEFERWRPKQMCHLTKLHVRFATVDHHSRRVFFDFVVVDDPQVMNVMIV